MDTCISFGGDYPVSIYEAILELVGDVPAGYEVLVWVVAAVVLLYLLCSTFSIIVSVLNWIAGK